MGSVLEIITDSINSIRDVLMSLQDDHTTKYAYRYSSHCVNNLNLDLYKQGKTYPDTIKKNLYISKTGSNLGIIRNIFHNLCKKTAESVGHGALLVDSM